MENDLITKNTQCLPHSPIRMYGHRTCSVSFNPTNYYFQQTVISCMYATFQCLQIMNFHVQNRRQKDNGAKCHCIVDTSSQPTSVHRKNQLPVKQMTNTLHITLGTQSISCRFIIGNIFSNGVLSKPGPTKLKWSKSRVRAWYARVRDRLKLGLTKSGPLKPRVRVRIWVGVRFWIRLSRSITIMFMVRVLFWFVGPSFNCTYCCSNRTASICSPNLLLNFRVKSNQSILLCEYAAQ